MNNYTNRLQRDKDGTLYGGVGSKLNDARAPLPSSAHLAIHENSKTILKEIAKQKYPQLEGADIVYNNTQKEKQTMLLEALEYAVSHPELLNKTKEEGITGEDTVSDYDKYPLLGFAPGTYQCKCSQCEKVFIGDKRAVQCEPCALRCIIHAIEEGSEQWKADYENLKAAEYIENNPSVNKDVADYSKEASDFVNELTSVKGWYDIQQMIDTYIRARQISSPSDQKLKETL